MVEIVLCYTKNFGLPQVVTERDPELEQNDVTFSN